MSKLQKTKVGISIGDPNGVGIEIILKTFEDKRVFDFFIPVVYSNYKMFLEQKNYFKTTTDIYSLRTDHKPKDSVLNILDVWSHSFEIQFGTLSNNAGELSYKSLSFAVDKLLENEVDVLVTAPINKKTIQSENFNFKGHTDYLAKRIPGDSLMFMINENLKLALVTDHIPIKMVSNILSEELLQKKLNLLLESLKIDFQIAKPKIAILGLNPHNGDNGLIGDEDDEIITPFIRKNFDQGNLIFGPYASDSFFGAQKYIEFDAILAIYHDQGLIPFKTLSFGKGVNYTAGLSHVRTSPDHGTAFDIAGEGKADISSFMEAMFTARTIFLNKKHSEGQGIY
jgi:4-hydroxythreonine-4-phosphate dehydrogenase